jgi:DNA-binding NarL/FixJ family response regulator
MTLRIVVAEDSYLVREGIQRVLERDPELELVGSGQDFPSTLAAVEYHAPDVLVTDIRMPPGNRDEGIEIAAMLRERNPLTGVVVLSQFDEPEYAVRLFERGSAGRAYLLKERLSEPGQLSAAIRQVAAGGSVIDPRVVESLLAARTKSLRLTDALTPREREVLALMAQGKTNDAIATILVLSVRVVEKHINAIFSKLGLTEEREVHRRVKAVLIHLAHDS